MVKVGLRAPDGEFETMWATPLGGIRYRLENSPFFAYRVSFLDIVEAEPEDDSALAVVRGVVEKSGHRTVRLILTPGVDEAPERRKVLDDLNALGCSYEGYNSRYFAVDVPPAAAFSTVVEYLTRGEHTWEYVDPSYDDVHPTEAEQAPSPAS